MLTYRDDRDGAKGAMNECEAGGNAAVIEASRRTLQSKLMRYSVNRNCTEVYTPKHFQATLPWQNPFWCERPQKWHYVSMNAWRFEGVLFHWLVGLMGVLT